MSETTERPADAVDCKSCKGNGYTDHAGFTSVEGKVYAPWRSKCYACDQRGWFVKPDVHAIVDAIRGRGGKGLRSKRPDDKRAYYVWRMARFHGGADVTMPMTASMGVHGDPFVKQLDVIADAVAKRVFGTDLAAAHRWGRALGIIDRDMPGLPDSAYSGGRVADADKPEEEAPELF